MHFLAYYPNKKLLHKPNVIWLNNRPKSFKKLKNKTIGPYITVNTTFPNNFFNFLPSKRAFQKWILTISQQIREFYPNGWRRSIGMSKTRLKMIKKFRFDWSWVFNPRTIVSNNFYSELSFFFLPPHGRISSSHNLL